MSDPSPRKLPEHLHHLAPKREDYPSQEDYEEARAYYRHRFRAAAQSPSKASPAK